MEKDTANLIAGVVLGFLAGIPSSFVASLWYDKSKEGRAQKAVERRRRDELWREILNSDEVTVQSRAFQQIIMKVLFSFIIGNVFFAMAGMTWLLDIFRSFPLSNLLASVTSMLASLAFGDSLYWIRLYFKLTKQSDPDSTPATKPPLASDHDKSVLP